MPYFLLSRVYLNEDFTCSNLDSTEVTVPTVWGRSKVEAIENGVKYLANNHKDLPSENILSTLYKINPNSEIFNYEKYYNSESNSDSPK